MADPTITIVFVAGIISFLSPCILPLIPGFLAYLGGTSAGKKHVRLKIFLNSVAFVLGFSLIFALLGLLLTTVLEGISFAVQTWLSRIGGIVIMLFALYLLGLIKLRFLEREHKFKVKNFSVSYITSFIFGAAFAVGWSPCVGAILGSVFTLAITQAGKAFTLLIVYSLGLGIPFLLVGLFTTQAIKLINKSKNALKYFNIVVGVLLLILGILVFTNKLVIIASFFFPRFLLN